MRKGVILCGGHGTRLMPLTLISNKHLLPIYNKPMFLYPLETLKSLGIKDILIVSGGEHIGRFLEFLGNGSKYGVNVTYRVQETAGGIADALGTAKEFANGEEITVILGDNIYDNEQIKKIIFKNYKSDRAYIFLKEVPDPQRFGVPVFAEWEDNGFERKRIIKIEEKPQNPKSNFAVTGLYCYPSNVFDVISTLKPSARGELEVTDLNNYYVKNNLLEFFEIEGYWSDAGMFDSLLDSSVWAREKEKSQALLT